MLPKLPKDNRELRRISKKPDMVEGKLSTCNVCGQIIMGLFGYQKKEKKYKLIMICPHTCSHIKDGDDLIEERKVYKEEKVYRDEENGGKNDQ